MTRHLRPASALTLIGSASPERADAARNRRKILEAANRLIAVHGTDGLTMDQVAHEAAVGVGTVYRRFANVAELAEALLDEREQQLQAAVLSGPPPVGSGAPALDRVHAFLHALLDRVLEQMPLLIVAEQKSPLARQDSPTYRFYHAHLHALLRKAGVDQHARYLTDALLGPLAPASVSYQLNGRGMTVDEIRQAIDLHSDRLLRP